MEEKFTNRLIIIGGLGDFMAYLNVSKEEAIGHYMRFYGMSREEFDEEAGIKEFGFNNWFYTYNAWTDGEEDDL